MDTFEKIVTQLINNEIDIEEACSLLEFWAESYPGELEIFNKASDMLNKRYEDHSISESYQSRILRSIQACSGAAHVIDDAEEDDDETVIAQLASRSPGKIEAAPAQSEAEIDDDATVFANNYPQDDITVQLEDGSSPVAAAVEKSQHDHADDDSGILKPGSILKGRFNLVSVLGEGGMGVVYKAIDMLKVEARDMNPYVAIKVLSEAFKEHPDAFISLQRETSKAQKLAHPNIATVYDFDRDKESIYMTMELLEGKPLDEFIKSMPKEGLPEEEALKIITGLGEGLAYAHANGLVHSDFKPGNAFVLYDGPVKVIDFGIARAAGGTAQEHAPAHDIHKTGLETNLNPAPTDNTAGATTDFDAGTLGALTPAYATVEMFEGKEPAPSDDIYALACVAVQLLTGKHPYKKLTAPKAKQKGMKPPVITGFSKRQQRALDKALEFTRDKRTETMEEFLDGIRRRKNYTKQIVLGTVVALSLIGGFGYKPITNYYEQQEIEKIILQANEGTSTRLLQTLSSLQEYTPERRNAIKNGIKDKALEIYATKIKEAIDIENGLYEFETANGYINEALSYYTDSAAIQDLALKTNAAREALAQNLHAKYLDQLRDLKLLPDETEEDLTDTLDLLKKIAPEDATFNDPRLEIAYYNAAQKSAQEKDFVTANVYLATGVKYVPQSQIYQELSDRIILDKLRNQINAAQPRAEGNIPTETVSLSELRPYINDLAILSLDIDQRSIAYNHFKKLFGSEFKQLLNSNVKQAQELLLTFSAALPIEKMVSYAEQLDSINATSTTLPEDKALTKTHFINNDTNLEQLVAQLSAIRSIISQYRINALTSYNLDFTSNIEALSTSNRASLIEYYNELYQPLLIADSKSSSKEYLVSTQKAHNTELTRVKIQANIENEKRIFRNIAAENRLKDSVSTYDKIVNHTDDAEFLEFAKKEITRMYSTLAESSATEDNYDGALTYALEASKYFTNERVEKQIKEYQKEIGTKEVARLILTRDAEDKISAKKLLKTLSTDYVDDYAFIIDKIGYLINLEIIPLADINILDAHRLKEHALSVVSSRIIERVSIKGLPPPSKLAIQGKIEVGQKNLSAAQSSLNKAIAAHPAHYQVDELRIMLDEQLKVAQDLYKEYEKYFNDEKYEKANKLLNNTIVEWKDNPAYIKERLKYDRIMKQVKANAKLCRTDLQGIGKQTRGTCNDVVLSMKREAPAMVVVPAMSIKSTPYAIGKYEVSINQLNDYCEATRQCTKLTSTDTELPATNVPKEIIENYTRWLSSETGFSYQIASHDQWRNAAASGGREGNSNYNCRLRLGTKLIKGQNIVPIKSGSVNNWGLINYVGNVDELVKTDNGYLLAGGNFSDSISDCKISLEKPFTTHNGSVGFRLVRNLE